MERQIETEREKSGQRVTKKAIEREKGTEREKAMGREKRKYDKGTQKGITKIRQEREKLLVRQKCLET